MPIEGFDYQNFAQVLSSQAGDLVPADFTEFQKTYVVNTLNNFSTLAGEALYNDSSINIDMNQAMLIVQIIAEWSFHKSVDLIKAGIPQENWDMVMQKIAFTIFEIGKQTVIQGLPQDQILQIVEHHVQKSYSEALDELKKTGAIDDGLLDKAVHQSNIDEMMEQIQADKAESGATSDAATNAKIVKLASVAILLKKLQSDKVRVILNKFSNQDAQTVLEYMQIPDLEEKVDKDVALKYLKDIKQQLPEPKVLSPKKLLGRFNRIISEKGATRVEIELAKERSNVKKLLKDLADGETPSVSGRVASIIANHLEEN